MLEEAIEGLAIRQDGIYVDATYGGGGHAHAILQRLGPDGRLLAFDQDEDAKQNVFNDSRLIFINQSFRYIKNNCRLYGVLGVDGILADLGVSSYQLDEPGRGFSTRFDQDLDMRMSRASSITAKEVLNTYPEEALQKVFGGYGEVYNAKTLAKTVVASRIKEQIVTVGDFKKVIQRHIPKHQESKYLAKVFQALRIEVNQELEALKEFLMQTIALLNPSGRLVVISYHSLEDRLVKNIMAKGKFIGDANKDFFGNVQKPFQALYRKPLRASEAERKQNPRARSAKLRVAERI